MCKPRRPVKAKKKAAKQQPSLESEGKNPPPATDTCLSSEEDECATAERISDAEDNGVADKSNQHSRENVVCDVIIPRTDALEADTDDFQPGNMTCSAIRPRGESEQVVTLPSIDELLSSLPVTTLAQVSRVTDAVQLEAEIGAGSPDGGDSCAAVDSTDSCASADSVTSPPDIFPEPNSASGAIVMKPAPEAKTTSALGARNDQDVTPVFHCSTAHEGVSDVATTASCQTTPPRIVTGSPSLFGSRSQEGGGTTLSLINPPLEPATPTTPSVEKSSAPSKENKTAVPDPLEPRGEDGCDASSFCRSWSSKTAAGITLAQIYLMLGKPSHFRLCYEWIEKSSERNAAAGREGGEPDGRLSSGLAALVQAATLLKTKLRDGDVSSDNSRKAAGKIVASSKKTSHVGVQCVMEDKVMCCSFFSDRLLLLQLLRGNQDILKENSPFRASNTRYRSSSFLVPGRVLMKV